MMFNLTPYIGLQIAMQHRNNLRREEEEERKKQRDIENSCSYENEDEIDPRELSI